MSKLDLKTLPEPGNKYKLGLKIGGGIGGDVFEAVETETGKKVAIKVIELKKETEEEIQREFQVLKFFSSKDNFPEFYGIYSKKGKDNSQKIWLVIEFCEGGDATDLVRKLEQDNKKMKEIHIAYIMRETIKAVIQLHENGIAHRDLRGGNIVLTGGGRVKLVDFGISKRLEKSQKMKTCVGSPSWLAPEVIACQTEEESAGYDAKADVWSLGITAIELGDGQAPLEDTHPARALFQICKNPPPTLRKPSDWSQLYNDFIGECLVKNPENRPYVQELLVHPFFEPLDKEENLLEDISVLLDNYKTTSLYKKSDVQVRKGFMRVEHKSEPEKILQEDLAAMNKVSEDSVVIELHERLKKGQTNTFIGDILLVLNCNKISDEYGEKYHKKYRSKAKSQNAPHIYSIAEGAYRDVFHHEKPQHVLFAGETGAGKTVNMMHAMDHLLFLGQGLNSSEKIPKALSVIHAMGNAATPHNANSTRHILHTQFTFTDTGKASGAVFRVYMLEKERVTMSAKKQENFHLFYYFFDALKSENKLQEFYLSEDKLEFLKPESDPRKGKSLKQNMADFQSFETNLIDLGFEEDQITAIKKILAAILLLRDVEFVEDEDGHGALASPEPISNIAELLEVDKKKLSWSLLNYCLIVSGEATMRHNTKQEAEEAKNVFARGLYSRLVDWVVNTINEKISVSRVIYGDKHIISLLDFYGFECYKKNTLNQLFVNSMNEQLQFHYNQKIFAWDRQTAKEDNIPFPKLEFNDNKEVVDLIMSKPDGLLQKIDEATKNDDPTNLLETLKKEKGMPVFAETSREFSINHYTGKLTYDVSNMVEKNRDFLPPEIIDTMRLSSQEVTKQLFSPLLSKSGNLSRQTKKRSDEEAPTEEKKWKEKKVNTVPSGQFSQSRQMRTAATTFRGVCVDLFKTLNVKDSGFHFVRCMRTDLSDKPGAFDPEVVRQQMRALAVVNTVLTTQQGYSYSVSHAEFIRRYKFLAFDFDETVEETKENCRLLLLRLKLEGWTMGKTKVFLKYFNKEYLSRLYETQLKKIVKVQSMMRAFMARRKLYAKIRRYQIDADVDKNVEEKEIERLSEARAATIIQKRFREFAASKSNLTEEQKEFIRPWCKRWRAKSIFQVLLLYRAERLQALVNFCLQIHIYNQTCLRDIQKTVEGINLEDIQKNVKWEEFLPPLKPSIPKILFTWESLNLRGDTNNCEPLPECNIETIESEMHASLCEVLKIAASEKDSTDENIKHEEMKKERRFSDKEIQTSLADDLKKEGTISSSTIEEEQYEKQNSFEYPVPEQEETPEKNAKNAESNDLKQESPMQEIDSSDLKQTQPVQEIKSDNSEQISPVQQIDSDNPKQTPPVQQVESDNKNQTISVSMEFNNLKKIIPEVVVTENHKEELRVAPRNDKKVNNLSPRDGLLQPRPSLVKQANTTKVNLSSVQDFKSSLNEMEEKFRNKNYNENSDDPPFNFRALLKKTNYNTEPRKNVNGHLIFQKELANFRFSERKSSVGCAQVSKFLRPPEPIAMELVPGILIYGRVTDL